MPLVLYEATTWQWREEGKGGGRVSVRWCVRNIEEKADRLLQKDRQTSEILLISIV